MMAVYLLHSTVAIGGKGSKGARHYLGYAADGNVERRLHEHKTRANAPAIIRAYRRAGGTLLLAYVWPEGGQALERYLKNRGHLARYCRWCRAEHKDERLREWPVEALPPKALGDKRLRKRMRENGGVSSPGSTTGSASMFHRVPPPGSSMFFAGTPEPTITTPGGASGTVSARPGNAGSSRAGTRHPWSATYKTTERSTEEPDPNG